MIWVVAKVLYRGKIDWCLKFLAGINLTLLTKVKKILAVFVNWAFFELNTIVTNLTVTSQFRGDSWSWGIVSHCNEYLLKDDPMLLLENQKRFKDFLKHVHRHAYRVLLLEAFICIVPMQSNYEAHYPGLSEHTAVLTLTEQFLLLCKPVFWN